MYRFLMLLTISSAVGLHAWRTLFDNFAVNVVGLEGQHIGIIQSVREIPGFLVFLVVFVMLLLKEHRISSLSILTLGIGVGAVGFFPSFSGLIVTTLIMSFGFHYYETTNQSLTLQYFDKKTSPLVFGRLRSLSAATNIGVGIFILAVATFLSYKQIYAIVGGALVFAALWGFRCKPDDREVVPQHKRILLKKKYWLYYLLTFLAGARRQIFVAFAVFLMVKKFGYSVQGIAGLFIINNVVNYFLSPLIGRAIIRFGERKVLSLEYGSLILVFTGYALVDSPILAAGLYIADHIFYNFAIAIRTFFQKVGEPEDIAPSMSAGFAINHIAAVVFPVFGGLLWMLNYRIPFIGGAVLSLASLIAVQQISGQIRRHGQGRPTEIPVEHSPDSSK
ncbi:MAG: MFS transporter [candidate division Zixibacteria bacterium]|nr:MFS transporter [candidate division Zixibacteria bacterium]